MQVKELTLLLTDRCPAACISCPLSCGPGNTNVMDEALAKELVGQAAALGCSRLVLSGGEPFLYPDLAGRIFRYAADRGIPERKVVTGGFWGDWDEAKKENAFRDMKDVLTHAAFRFDSFHAEYVGTDALWKAIRFLGDFRVERLIEVADVYGERGAGAFLASLDEKAINRAYAVYPLLPIGRAKELPAECFIKAETMMAPQAVAVDWEGNIFRCARPGIPLTGKSLGNVRRTPIPEIIGKEGGS